jgi:type I restriction enzyme R subunit
MSLHKEIALESEICAHLADHGWFHAAGDAAHYDRARALYPPDLVAWMQESQPKAWETLTKQQGSATEATLLDRVRTQLEQRGTSSKASIMIVCVAIGA